MLSCSNDQNRTTSKKVISYFKKKRSNEKKNFNGKHIDHDHRSIGKAWKAMILDLDKKRKCYAFFTIVLAKF